VHPEVWGLQPNREYYYRFRAGTEISPVGRTKTAPAFGARVGAVSFAFASCQHYAHGHYTALGHLAEEDLDVAFHLGDYIYESGAKGSIGRPHLPAAEIVSLADYRIRYGQYKSDPNLLAAHAAVPWVVVPDDHEVENNWADEVPEESSDTEGRAFLARRAAALQAYYENLPLRASAMPNGIDMQLYRQLSYGNLIDFNMLDTRQYRDDQAGGDGWQEAYPEGALDPGRTMMGWEQEAWLLNNFARSSARWQVLGNQAPIAETDIVPGPGKKVHMDPWDGYVANRNRILQGALDRDVANLVVITGDRHKNYACDLLSDYNEPDSPVVGSEFVASSVSSTGDGGDMHGGRDNPADDGELLLAANPHMKFFNAQRGYVRCRVTPDEWRTDFRIVPYVTEPGAPISTRATYVVENGVPGPQRDT
jgi:alkaline phosphatase D